MFFKHIFKKNNFLRKIKSNNRRDCGAGNKEIGTKINIRV